MKGALREIRRDKSFLGKVKIKQQIQRYDLQYLIKNITKSSKIVRIIVSKYLKDVTTDNHKYFSAA